jgi:predicted Fe-S protein YdhL (DUF1289 family)
MENDVCIGCGRTVEEVVEWYNMTDTQKQAVLNRLEKKEKSWFK